jgi:hypothetical protein
MLRPRHESALTHPRAARRLQSAAHSTQAMLRGPRSCGYPPRELLRAIIRAEHSAAQASAGSGQSVRELLEPIREQLEHALAAAPPENRTRRAIVVESLAREIGHREVIRNNQLLAVPAKVWLGAGRSVDDAPGLSRARSPRRCGHAVDVAASE